MDEDGAGVGVGLGDGGEAGAPPDEDVLVLVPAEDEVERGDGAGQGLVLGQRQVRERDDDVGLALKRCRLVPRRLDGVADANVGGLVGVERDPEEANAGGVPVGVVRCEHAASPDARERCAIGAHDVRGDPRELGLTEEAEELLLLHVELVVPERGVVEPQRIEGGHHLPPRQPLPVHLGRPERGGAKEVAGHDGDGVGVLGLEPPEERAHAGESALAPPCQRRDLVDVVELDDHDLDEAVGDRPARWLDGVAEPGAAPGEANDEEDVHRAWKEAHGSWERERVKGGHRNAARNGLRRLYGRAGHLEAKPLRYLWVGTYGATLNGQQHQVVRRRPRQRGGRSREGSPRSARDPVRLQHGLHQASSLPARLGSCDFSPRTGALPSYPPSHPEAKPRLLSSSGSSRAKSAQISWPLCRFCRSM